MCSHTRGCGQTFAPLVAFLAFRSKASAVLVSEEPTASSVVGKVRSFGRLRLMQRLSLSAFATTYFKIFSQALFSYYLGGATVRPGHLYLRLTAAFDVLTLSLAYFTITLASLSSTSSYLLSDLVVE